jgi:hypothetical protein
MKLEHARAKAHKIWGDDASVMERKPMRYRGNDGKPGIQAETHLVGIRMRYLPAMEVYGRGFSWVEAFKDATARGYGRTVPVCRR